MDRKTNVAVTTEAHRDMSGSATAAGNRENLEFALKEWVGRVDYLHVALAGIGPARGGLVPMWGIQNGS